MILYTEYVRVRYLFQRSKCSIFGGCEYGISCGVESVNLEMSTREDLPPTFSPLSFCAGCVAGASAMLIGHPFDTLKVHGQVHSRATPPLSVASLYRGWFGPVASYGVVTSITLWLFENSRRALNRAHGLSPAESSPLVIVSIASVPSCIVTLITCPMQRIKVVQQLSGTPFLPTARALFKEGTLYRGWFPTLTIELSRVIYLPFYALGKRYLSGDGTDGDESLPLWARVVAGAGANVAIWAIIYPVDVIKSLQQSASPGGKPRAGDAVTAQLGTLACARKLVHDGGLRALYRGFWWTLLRAGPVAGVLLPCFDITLALLERATQQHRS
jgi:solute carrier family 25 carnitine/acylcarnitine transporter 20/29